VRKTTELFTGDPKSVKILQHAERVAGVVHDWYAIDGSDFNRSAEIIWRVILADQLFPDKRLPTVLSDAKLPLPFPPTTADDVEKLLSVPAILKALRYLYGRRVFMTTAGRLGLGPCDMKEGDEIVIMGGGKVPYVLRMLQKHITKTFTLYNNPPVRQFIGEWSVYRHVHMLLCLVLT